MIIYSIHLLPPLLLSPVLLLEVCVQPVCPLPHPSDVEGEEVLLLRGGADREGVPLGLGDGRDLGKRGRRGSITQKSRKKYSLLVLQQVEL